MTFTTPNTPQIQGTHQHRQGILEDHQGHFAIPLQILSLTKFRQLVSSLSKFR